MATVEIYPHCSLLAEDALKFIIPLYFPVKPFSPFLTKNPMMFSKTTLLIAPYRKILHDINLFFQKHIQKKQQAIFEETKPNE